MNQVRNISQRRASEFLARLGSAGRLVYRSAPRLATLLIIGSIVIAGLAALEVFLLREVVSALEAADSATAALVFFGAVAASRRTILSASGQGQVYVARLVERSATHQVLTAASACSFEQLENPEFRDQVQRALDGARTRLWQMVLAAVSLLTTALSALSLTALIIVFAADLLLVILAAGSVLVLASVFKSRMSYRLVLSDTQPDRERAYLRSALTSTVEGKELRLSGNAQLLLDRHDSNFAARIDAFRRVVNKRVIADLISNVVLTAAVITALVFIARRASAGELELANAAAIAIAVQQLTSLLLSMSGSASSLMESTLVLRDLDALGFEPAQAQNISGQVDGLRLRTATYTYPGTVDAAVDDISITIAPGEVVALVGTNGSGKSTAAKLLTGLYAPQRGSVEIRTDGEWKETTGPLTGVVSALFQEFGRYELSFGDNITLGYSERFGDEEQRVRDVADQVGLGEAANLDRRLGRSFTGGVDLSGGEWQRLALARALYSPAPFLLLDEPSSAVDAKGEQELFAQIRHIAPGRGVLLISHRFATVRNADRVIVLDEGKVVEEGPHDQLIKEQGPYAALFRSQYNHMFGDQQ